MAKNDLEAAATSSAVSGHKGRDRWICAILTRDILPLLEVRVAVRLGIFFNCKTGKCDPGYPTLASELGISRRTLFRAIARLKADGWIEIHRLGGENVQFSLFIPPPQPASPDEALPSAGASIVAPHGGANIVTPAEAHGGANIATPAEPSKQVTENEGAGDRNRGVEVPHRVAAHKNLKPENLKSAALHAARSADADRDSILIDSATASDVTPNQRASDEALIETVTAQNPQPPSSASTETELGTAANDADTAERWVQFLNVERRWPPGCIGDQDAAFRAFCKIMVRGRLWIIADAIEALANESGDDVPPLNEALASLRFP